MTEVRSFDSRFDSEVDVALVTGEYLLPAYLHVLWRPLRTRHLSAFEFVGVSIVQSVFAKTILTMQRHGQNVKVSTLFVPMSDSA